MDTGWKKQEGSCKEIPRLKRHKGSEISRYADTSHAHKHTLTEIEIVILETINKVLAHKGRKCVQRVGQEKIETIKREGIQVVT